MKILAIEQELPGISADAFTPQRLRAEAARVWELYQADVLREIYFRTDRHAAVLMLECADVNEAQHILATLPLVQAALITFELLPS
jgi:hypothetical protein